MIALVYNIHQPLIAWMGTCGTTYTPNGHQIRGWNPYPIFLDQWQMCWRWETPPDEGWIIHGGTPEIDGLFLKENAMKKKNGWFGGKKWGSPISRKPPFLKVCHSLPGISVLVPKNSRVFPPPTSQGALVGRAAHQRSALLHDHRVDGHGSGECDPQQAGAYGSLGHLGHI